MKALRIWMSVLALLGVLLVGAVAINAQDAEDTAEPTPEATEPAEATPEAPIDDNDNDEGITLEVTAEATAEIILDQGEADPAPMPIMVQMAGVRAAHLVPDAPAVDIYVDGEVAIEGLEYPDLSEFVMVEPGDHEVAVAPAGTSIDEAVIGPTTITAQVNQWFTLSAVGSLEESTQQVSFFRTDYTLALEDDEARVTVFHGIAGAPPVTVLVNGSELGEDIAYPGTYQNSVLGTNDGAFTTDVPAGTYDISVVVAADPASVVLDLEEVTIEAGTLYFVAAIGTPEEPDAALFAVPASEVSFDTMMTGDGAQVTGDPMSEMGAEPEVTPEATEEATPEATPEATEAPAEEDETEAPEPEATEESDG